MTSPISDLPAFDTRDVNICILPHLSELLVVGSRSVGDSGLKTSVMDTADLMGEQFHQEIKRPIDEERTSTREEGRHLARSAVMGDPR